MSVKAEVAPQTNIKLKEVHRPEGKGTQPFNPTRLKAFRPIGERAPFGMRPQVEGVSSAERTVVYDVVKQGRTVDLTSPLRIEDGDTNWKTTPQGEGQDPKVDSV